MPLDLTCAQCGKQFQRSPSKATRSAVSYCSNECTHAARHSILVLTCDYCGTRFERKPAEVARSKRHYCSKRCMGDDKRMDRSEWWKGGATTTAKGYVRVKMPDGSTRFQHRVVMEQVLGRPLEPDEEVHHINGIRHDNRPENLQVMKHREHMRLHFGVTNRWSSHSDACVTCGTTERKHQARGMCMRCYLRWMQGKPPIHVPTSRVGRRSKSQSR